MYKTWVLIALIFVGSPFVTDAQSCTNAAGDENAKSRRIELYDEPAVPSFYFRASHYAILVAADVLIDTLEAAFRRYESPLDGRLLVELKRNSPLKENTDLFKFVLTDSRYLQRIELLLANMLEGGKATVVDVWQLSSDPNRALEAIILVHIDSGSAGTRRFCTPSGDLLLDVTDYVAD